MDSSISSGSAGSWVIPDEVVGPQSSLFDAARLLSRVFRIVPVTSEPTAARPGEDASKNPGGLLGKGWPEKSSRDEMRLFGWFSAVRPDHRAGPVPLGAAWLPEGWYREVEPDSVGMGLHVGSDVVVADIDYPEKVPAQMWPFLDVVPFQSTSAVDPRRGHYFFRKREGFFFGQTSAIPGRDGEGSPGEVRHGNAIVLSSPTPHPKVNLGRRYEWVRAGEIPVMPEPVAEWLQSERRSSRWNGCELSVSEASLDSLEAFREQFTESAVPEVLGQHLDFMRRQADARGLHSSTLPGLINLLQYAACGVVAAGEAIDAAGAQFVLMRTDPGRGDGSWSPVTSSVESAQREFVDLLRWAAGRVHAKLQVDAEAVRYETLTHAAYFYDVPLPSGLEAPPGYVELPPSAGGGVRDVYHPVESEDERGRRLVRNEHVPLAEACAEFLVDRYRWVQNAGVGGEGEWWVYDREQLVWGRGGQKAGVVREVINMVAGDEALFAPYDVVEVEKAGKVGARVREVVDALMRLHGKSAVFYRLSARLGNMPDINHVVDALKTVPSLWARVEQFDAGGSRVALGNGVLDVKSKAFEVSSPLHKVTKRAPVTYDPSATCPKFEKFLLECVVRGGDYVDAKRVADTIKRYFGAALLGDWESDNFLVAHGPAGSGKSTVFEDVVRAVLGHESGYWSMITPQVFTRGINEAGRKFELASVSGARFLTCNEAFDGASSIDAGFLKSFTDGSTQRAAYKGRDNFLMTPGRVVFMSNELPKLTGVDAGISRRAVFIEFPHGHDRSDPLLPDPDEKLFTRDLLPELSGILNWMIEGAHEYLAVGLNPPTSLFENTREALSDSSVMGTFLRYFRPVTEDDPQHWQDGSAALSLKDIHDLYKDYLTMTDPGGGRGAHSVTTRGLASAITSTYRTVQIDMSKRENFYLEDGTTRRKQVAIRGLMPNEDYSAFLIERGTRLPSGIEVQRHRIGVGDVEDWRRRRHLDNRETAGSAI